MDRRCRPVKLPASTIPAFESSRVRSRSLLVIIQNIVGIMTTNILKTEVHRTPETSCTSTVNVQQSVPITNQPLPETSRESYDCWLVYDVIDVIVWYRLCGTSPLTTPLSIPQMIYGWIWSSGGTTLRGKIKGLEKSCPNAALPSTHPAQKALETNPGLCSEKLKNNRLWYGTVMSTILPLRSPAQYEYRQNSRI
jgi:hypothetical protein